MVLLIAVAMKDYTVSHLRLPVGVADGAAAAVEARLAPLRRAAGPRLLATVTSSPAHALLGAEVRVEWGATASPGSFSLAHSELTLTLTVRRGDVKGLLAGVGRVVRELRVNRTRRTAHLPMLHCEHNASAALWPLRGHQVSTAHHSSSFKTWQELRAYIADLAVFGTNQIELAHTDGSEAALVNFSRAVGEAGLNVSLWNPCGMPGVETTFAAMPRVDSLLHEGGWTRPGESESLATCARLLRRHHPHASVWAAAAAHNVTDLAEFFATAPRLGFVTGLATHMAPTPFPDYVELAAAASKLAGRWPTLPIRQYPDLCHTVHAQFPVPEWHWAWAVTHGRNPITVLPYHMANIVRQSVH